MRRLLPLLCLLPVLVLAACGGGGGSETTTEAATTTATTTASGDGSTVGCVDVTAPAPKTRKGEKPTEDLDASKTYEVIMKTNCGSFTITLDQKQSPNTAASFAGLVRDGFYDGTVFHRIVPGFVIQGGDPTATGTGGPGYSTVDKPPADATYPHGVVAMAKTAAEAPGTSGSQFFIVTAADAGLPPEYAIVGTVTKGIDVVDAIGQLGGPDEQPTQVVEIEKATLSES
jgi:peptidyl-prolyl cis-trans isomerase B (cyclophilin B)